MGGGNSKILAERATLSKSDTEIVNLMLPVFYTKEDVTKNDIQLARGSWQLIIDEKSDHFKALSADPNFGYTSCMLYFFDVFYARLFDVHPLCEPMFKHGIKAQGKFLVKMISLSLSLLDDPKQFEDTMVSLANAHNKRGVRANEYGIVGEVLFYSIKHCIGNSYTPDIHIAWVRIFSRMLKYIVPIAVAFELREGDAQVQRMNDLGDMLMKELEEFKLKNDNATETSSTSSSAMNF